MKLSNFYNVLVIAIFCSLSSIILSTEKSEQDGKERGFIPYTRIFEKPTGPCPDKDDPFQECPVALSPDLVNHLSRYSKDSYKFPEDIHSLTICGNYGIDENALLGDGDEGIVRLGRHLETKIFVAVKMRRMERGQETVTPEFCRLQRLGRIYSLWLHTESDSCLMVIPLVDGCNITSLNTSWMTKCISDKTLNFSDFGVSLSIIDSLVKECTYLASRGIVQPDGSSGNVMITYQSRQFVLVDFGYQYDNPGATIYSPISPEAFNVYYYKNYCPKLFGIQSHKIDEYDISPKYLETFLKKISEQRENWFFSLLEFMIEYQIVKLLHVLSEQTVFPTPEYNLHLLICDYYID